MRRSGFVLLLVSMLLVGGGALGSASVGAAAPPSKDAVIASGIVESLGEPVKGALVAVMAYPTSEAIDAAGADGVAMHPLGTSETDGRGRFVVTGDLLAVPATHRLAGGGADVMVVVDDAARSMSRSYTLRPPDAGPGAGTVAVAKGRAVPSSGRHDSGALAPAMRFDLGAGTVWDIGNDPANWIGADGHPLGEGRRTEAARAHVDGPSPIVAPLRAPRAGTQGLAFVWPPGCVWQATDQWIYGANEVFDQVWSWGGALVTAYQGQSGSTSHTLGLLAEYSNGSFATSGTRTLTVSASATQAGIADATIYNRVNYRKYAGSFCGAVAEWRPVSYFAFFTNFVFAGDVNYGTCALQFPGQNVTIGSTTNDTFSTGVTLAFWTVSSQTGYDSSYSITYNVTQRSHVCGSTAAGPVSSPRQSARAA
jgi:hypothetical protein